MLRLPAYATAAIVVALALYLLTGWLGERRKLADVPVPLPDRGSYRITLDFAPERFHQLMLQEKGRLVEVKGTTVFMRDVAPAALRDIARQYWVEAVEPWSGS